MNTKEPLATKQDILQCLLTRGQATALDLASTLQLSPQGVRRHLKDLHQEGLVLYQSNTIGMGRPQHVYQLSPKGREKFPNQYDRFVVSLLDSLIESLGTEATGSILEHHWERKTSQYRQLLGDGSLRQRVAKLVELRRQEGYMAEFHPLSSDETEFVFTEHNCAIAQVAASFPIVCHYELKMLSDSLAGCEVERTHWSIDGDRHCGYLIRDRRS
jgi:DeoR family suf operon transcriptional repressor